MTVSPKLRRRMLLGAASVCLPLPFLEMLWGAKAQAQAASPQRFVVVYAPGGAVPELWNPTGTGETDHVLPSVLSPLEPWRQKVLITQDLGMKVAEISQGNAHAVGSGAMLTGQILQGNDGFADGPSVDQVIAKTVGSATRFASREFGVSWPTGGGGNGSSLNIINYAGPAQPVPPSVDPSKIFREIFSGLSTPAPVGPDPMAALRAQRRSVLDRVISEFTTFNSTLGAGDKVRLDAHLQHVRDLEMSLGGTGGGVTTCTVPTAPASVDINDDNSQPEVAKIMTALLVMALACDQTRVASLVFADSIAFHHFPFLGFTENYHAYQHDKGYQPNSLAILERWHTERLADLLKAMEDVKEGPVSLLDNSVVLSVSEISHPEEHGTTMMPFLLAGGGNKLRAGRRMLCQDVPHNKLLLSIANAFGSTATTFGHPDYNSGPLAGVFG